MQRKEPEPNLVSYLLSHCLAGVVTGLFWAVLMLATNTAGLGLLIFDSAHPTTNLAIFLTGSAVTFQPIAAAVAIGRLASKRDA